MELLIAGETTEIKGAELEKFCRNLFSKFGLNNSTINVVDSGANEYDVTAYDKNNIPIMAECKAYSKPCDMNHWLKFLGKLYLLKQEYPEAKGFFVALSGVNGNVWGNFQNIKQHDNSISILAKDELIKYVTEEYKMLNQSQVREIVHNYTNRGIDTCDILLYNNNAYWIIRFNSLEFSILTSDNQPFSTEDYNNISSVLSKKYFFSFIDLVTERARLERIIFVKGLILCAALNNCTQSEETIKAFVSERNINVSIEEIKSLIPEIKYITHNFPIEIKMPIKKSDFYLYILYHTVFNDTIKSDFYQENINDELLDEILTLQGNINLDETQRENSLRIMKISMTALQNILHPDNFIINSSKNFHLFDISKKEWLYEQIRDKFFKLLMDGLEIDLSKQVYWEIASYLGVNNYKFIQKFILNENSENSISIESSPHIHLLAVTNLPGNPVIPIVTSKEVNNLSKANSSE